MQSAMDTPTAVRCLRLRVDPPLERVAPAEQEADDDAEEQVEHGAARSRLRPFARLARTLREHRDGILAAVRLGRSQRPRGPELQDPPDQPPRLRLPLSRPPHRTRVPLLQRPHHHAPAMNFTPNSDELHPQLGIAIGGRHERGARAPHGGRSVLRLLGIGDSFRSGVSVRRIEVVAAPQPAFPIRRADPRVPAQRTPGPRAGGCPRFGSAGSTRSVRRRAPDRRSG